MMHQVIAIISILLHSVYSHSDDLCIPVRRDAQDQTSPSSFNMQGRPGKIGPPGAPGAVGAIGPKGEQGLPGECACDLNEIRRENQRMKGEIEELNFIVKTVNYESLCYAGVKDRRVRDQDMSASSYWSSGYKASDGRLDNTGEPNGFWYAASGKEGKPGEWLQVDFIKPVRIVGVITQGRTVRALHWVTSYKISYGNSTSSMQTIENKSGNDVIFQGNRDINTHVTNMFPEPVTARYFRIIVQTVHGATALRIEYLLC